MHVFLIIILVLLFNTSIIHMHDDLTRIVGGFSCVPEDYPYLVSIQHRKYGHFCGGSLINDRWVLTAAHCCNSTETHSFRIFAGLSELRTDWQTSLVLQKHIHPKYTLDPISHDACLLLLETLMVESNTVSYIKLAGSRSVELEQACNNALVLGFGEQGKKFLNNTKMEPIPVYDPTLKCANIQALSMLTCYKAVPFLDESTFCAIDPEFKGRDPCQGDSGGPFICDNVQYGIVSAGFGCGLPNFPSLYAKVDEFEDFIKETVAKIDSRRSHSTHLTITFILQLFLFVFLM